MPPKNAPPPAPDDGMDEQQQCIKCKRSKPTSEYLNVKGTKQVKTCRECRELMKVHDDIRTKAKKQARVSEGGESSRMGAAVSISLITSLLVLN